MRCFITPSVAANTQFQRLLTDHGVVCSMSRSGNVWDNAAMESFLSSLKTERTARKSEGQTQPGPASCLKNGSAVDRGRTPSVQPQARRGQCGP
jgi:transposase InsO family protein